LLKTDINNYQRYQKLYTQFNESANFLLQTSDATACAKIKDRLLHLNKRWKLYQDRFKDTQYEQLLKFYECEHSLNMVKERLNKIESLINKQLKSNLTSIGKYQEELQKAFNDVECLDANLKLLQKLTGRLDLDKNSMPMSQFMEDIRYSESRLLNYRQQMPDYLKNLTKVYTNISKIEESIQKIENWITEGECLLRVEADQLNFEQILSQIERQKVYMISFRKQTF
jgi:ppGpp synthetase/RelA/SpoT-type nucleotidyltranferase